MRTRYTRPTLADVAVYLRKCAETELATASAMRADGDPVGATYARRNARHYAAMAETVTAALEGRAPRPIPR